MTPSGSAQLLVWQRECYSRWICQVAAAFLPCCFRHEVEHMALHYGCINTEVIHKSFGGCKCSLCSQARVLIYSTATKQIRAKHAWSCQEKKYCQSTVSSLGITLEPFACVLMLIVAQCNKLTICSSIDSTNGIDWSLKPTQDFCFYSDAESRDTVGIMEVSSFMQPRAAFTKVIVINMWWILFWGIFQQGIE